MRTWPGLLQDWAYAVVIAAAVWSFYAMTLGAVFGICWFHALLGAAAADFGVIAGLRGGLMAGALNVVLGRGWGAALAGFEGGLLATVVWLPIFQDIGMDTKELWPLLLVPILGIGAGILLDTATRSAWRWFPFSHLLDTALRRSPASRWPWSVRLAIGLLAIIWIARPLLRFLL